MSAQECANDEVDATDARLLLALAESPRASVLALAERSLGLGYPLTAFVAAQVVQRMLAEVAAALHEVPEVVEVLGIIAGQVRGTWTTEPSAPWAVTVAGAVPGSVHSARPS